jgi:hypothetical protein
MSRRHTPASSESSSRAGEGHARSTITRADRLHASKPVSRSPADIICLAVYTLTSGQTLQGRLVSTVAQQLGITFALTVELAEAAEAADLIHFEHGFLVSLTEEGRQRGATLSRR